MALDFIRRLRSYYDVDRYIHIVRAIPENENSMIVLAASGLDGAVLMINGSSRVLVEKLWVPDVQSKSFPRLFGPIC
jgi:hypothetical protein